MKVAALLVIAFVAGTLGQSLLEVLRDQPALSNLTTALESFPNITQLFSGELNGTTVIAPNNDAFTYFRKSEGALGPFTTNLPFDEALFGYHVINQPIPMFDENEQLYCGTELLPPVCANVTLGQCVKVIAQPNGLNSAGNTTFTSGLELNSTSIQDPIKFENNSSYIYIVDRFLTMPKNFTTTAEVFNATIAAKAFVSTGTLLESLSRRQNTTFLIPNDAAFNSFGALAMNRSSGEIANILKYHVLPGLFYRADFVDNTSIPTRQGALLHVHGPVDQEHKVGEVWVDQARITKSDLLVFNGIMHMIGGVLDPNESNLTPAGTCGYDILCASTSSTLAPASTMTITQTVSLNSVSPIASSASTAISVTSASATTESSLTSTVSSSRSSGKALPTAAIEVGSLFGVAGVAVMLVNL